LDTTTKTVTLNNSQSIIYEYLVIATGSHTAAVNSGIPVKQPTTDTLLSSIQSAQTRIANASTIVIGGSGAVAIELAGEIAEGDPKKKVTIVSGSGRLLPILDEKASGLALKRLEKLGVEVLLGIKVLEKSESGKEVPVILDNGKVIEADLYIPAVGVIPNNSFIPPELLDASGYLITTSEQKVSSPKAPDVYGVGDITTNLSKMAVTVIQQIAVTVANLKNDIEKTGKRKAFKTEKTTMVIPIGGKGGVAEMGDLGGLVLWSWVVGLLKGNFFIPVAFMISGFKKQ
jgi:NADH dehydrogenase FAD-containing subunit